MYKNIMHALIDAGKTKKDLAADLGWSYTRCRDKLSGKVKITFDEAVEMKAALGTNCPIETLFARENKNRVNVKDIKSK